MHVGSRRVRRPGFDLARRRRNRTLPRPHAFASSFTHVVPARGRSGLRSFGTSLASSSPRRRPARGPPRTTAAPAAGSPARLGVLDEDVPDPVRGRVARVDRVLERLVDVLPADHEHRVDPVVLEEAGARVAGDAGRPRPRSALIVRTSSAEPRRPFSRPSSVRELLGRAHEQAAELERLARRRARRRRGRAARRRSRSCRRPRRSRTRASTRSSRSYGVMELRLDAAEAASEAMRSPACSSSLTSSCVTDDDGYSRKRCSTAWRDLERVLARAAASSSYISRAARSDAEPQPKIASEPVRRSRRPRPRAAAAGIVSTHANDDVAGDAPANGREALRRAGADHGAGDHVRRRERVAVPRRGEDDDAGGRLRREPAGRLHLVDALADRAHDPPAAGVGPGGDREAGGDLHPGRDVEVVDRALRVGARARSRPSSSARRWRRA